jgi:neutral ceramidase
MKPNRIILGQIISGLFIIYILNSCSVVRTPYFKTGYYQKTVSRLDSIKSDLSCVNDSLFAGFARVSITPALNNKIVNSEYGRFNKVPLAGFGQRKGRPATGVHDSIFVKAVALKAGQQLLVLVSADLLIMPPNIIDSVTLLLSEEGFQRNQIFYSATHSHSSIGGWAYGLIGKTFAGKENINLEKWLISQLKKAVLNAISDLHPARIGSGSFDASPYTRNRLTGKWGKKNDEFNFIVLEQTGRRKAIIGSFSAHATTLGDNNMQFSADYPGYWERKIEERTADLAMFCGGSMGSQSPVGQGSGFENAKYIGEALADSLSAHLKQVTMNEKLTTTALSLKILLPEYHFRLTTNINLSSGLSNKLMELPKNVYLQTLRINNLVWVFTPGDFSGESALQIKNLMAAKGYETIVSGFNGSYVGYIIPGKYFYLDHYESKLMGWFGPTMGDYTMDLIDQMIGAVILCKTAF